jgi:DNA-binding MarR family transcriptional regulator
MLKPPRSREPSPGALEALRLLRALIASLGRSARAIAADTGVTNAQLFLLRQIEIAGDPSIGELADGVRARQNSVSSVVRLLVRDGWVRKVASPRDARRVILRLTPAGRRLLGRAPAAPTEVLLQALMTLEPRPERALTLGMRALVAALGIAPDEAPLLFEDHRQEAPS